MGRRGPRAAPAFMFDASAMIVPLPVQPAMSRKLRRDLRTLALFVDVFCRSRHRHDPKGLVALKTHDVRAIYGKPLYLCDDCRKLLIHAFIKRTYCPLDPKPACKKCPQHCYAPAYRARIRQVMKYSGQRLILRGRLDYLFHMFT